MAAPNIVSVSTITGKTAVQAIDTSATAIVTNAASSNKVFKINSLYISNVDGVNEANVTVDLFRSSISPDTAYHLAKDVTVPAQAVLEVITKPIYLEEEDALRLTSNFVSRLEAVCSYEEIS